MKVWMGVVAGLVLLGVTTALVWDARKPTGGGASAGGAASAPHPSASRSRPFIGHWESLSSHPRDYNSFCSFSDDRIYKQWIEYKDRSDNRSPVMGHWSEAPDGILKTTWHDGNGIKTSTYYWTVSEDGESLVLKPQGDPVFEGMTLSYKRRG